MECSNTNGGGSGSAECNNMDVKYQRMEPTETGNKPIDSDQELSTELSILDLPSEIILKIISFLDSQGLKSLFTSSSNLRTYINDNKVWKCVCREKWDSNNSFRFRKMIRSWKDYHDKKISLLTEDNGLSWIEIKVSGEKPSPRYMNSAVSIDQYIYFIGGQEKCTKRFDEIYRFDTTNFTYEKIKPEFSIPPKFSRHTSVAIGNKIFTHGGYDGFGANHNLSVYDTVTNRWEYINNSKGDTPRSRTNHAAAVIGDLMYIFGGLYSATNHNQDLVFLNDFYAYNAHTNHWTQINGEGDIPPPKCGHKMFAFNQKLVLIGGGAGPNWEEKYNDVHIYDPKTNLWKKVQTKGELPVSTFTVSYPIDTFLFIFGGQSIEDTSLTSDLYMLDLVDLEFTKIHSDSEPPRRDMGSGVIVDNTLYLFGGYSGGPTDSLYSLDLASRFTNKDFNSIKPFS